MKRYLGDGAYADVDPYGRVVLTTWDGICDTNTIVLEAEVLREFERWLGDARRRSSEDRPQPSKAPPP